MLATTQKPPFKKWETYVDTALRHESNTSLGISRLVLGQELKLVVLILKVPDVAITLAGKVQTARGVIPERHADTTDRVQVCETADRLVLAGLPESDLAITHAREASGRDTVVLTHPNGARALCALVTRSYVGGLLLTNVPYAQLLVAGGGHQEVSTGVPRKGLHDVVVLQLEWCLSRANVPELDGIVARGGGEDVFSRGIEKDLADLSMRLSDSFPPKVCCTTSSWRTSTVVRTSSVLSVCSRAQHLLAPQRR